MTKTELAREITRANGGNPLIKLSKIAEIVGDKNARRVKRTYLEGLEVIGNRHFVPEVTEALKRNAKI